MEIVEILVYVMLGILGFCFLLLILYHCSKSSEVAEYDDHQENEVKQDNNMEPSRNDFPSSLQTNTYGGNNHMTPSSNVPHSLGEPSGNQNERQENNLNPAFNPTFNPTAVEMPPNPEYEARNRFPSSFQTNTYGANNHMTSSSNLPHSLGEPSGNQNERQENNLNPAFNPTFNPTAVEMPPNPEYEARNRFPSSFQTNTYGANNPMTPSSNLPYSLTPGEANGNQKGSEPAYAGGWVNQSYKHTE